MLCGRICYLSVCLFVYLSGSSNLVITGTRAQNYGDYNTHYAIPYFTLFQQVWMKKLWALEDGKGLHAFYTNRIWHRLVSEKKKDLLQEKKIYSSDKISWNMEILFYTHYFFVDNLWNRLVGGTFNAYHVSCSESSLHFLSLFKKIHKQQYFMEYSTSEGAFEFLHIISNRILLLFRLYKIHSNIYARTYEANFWRN